MGVSNYTTQLQLPSYINESPCSPSQRVCGFNRVQIWEYTPEIIMEVENHLFVRQENYHLALP